MQYENKRKKKTLYYITAKFRQSLKNEEYMKILGDYFIKKNKKNCKIIYKNKIYDLKTYFEDIYINNNHNNEFKIKIFFINNIIDMSDMFYDYTSLFSLKINNETNQNISFLHLYIKNLKDMFFDFKFLATLPELLNWNISNIKDMRYILYECNSLKSLPCISNLNTSNVNEIEYILYGGNSFISLSDLSKWNSFNIKDIRLMFNGYQFSTHLSDLGILNLDRYNIIFELTYKFDKTNKSKMRILGKKFIENNKFKGEIIYNMHKFDLIEYFEDIEDSKYHKDKIILFLCLDDNIYNISFIFYECTSLISIKRIYKLEYEIINNQSYKYEKCNNKNYKFKYSQENNL